jgi:hypothetical protein
MTGYALARVDSDWGKPGGTLAVPLAVVFVDARLVACSSAREGTQTSTRWRGRGRQDARVTAHVRACSWTRVQVGACVGVGACSRRRGCALTSAGAWSRAPALEGVRVSLDGGRRASGPADGGGLCRRLFGFASPTLYTRTP